MSIHNIVHVVSDDTTGITIWAPVLTEVMSRSLTSMSVSIKVSFGGDHKNEILDQLRKFAADKMIRVDIEELLSTPGSTEEDNVVVVAENDQICDQPVDIAEAEHETEVLIPKQIAADVRKWLTTKNVGQVQFANKVLYRAQSTFSDLIRNAPETLPRGHGKKIWEQMHKFLCSPQQRKELVMPQQRKELVMLSNKRKYIFAGHFSLVCQ